MDEAQIRAETRQFILDEFLPGTPAEELTDDMGLMSGGVLNSLATTRLVSFLEEKYGVQLEAHEMSADHMDSVDLITTLVLSKK
jgi:acyl carrier protein